MERDVNKEDSTPDNIERRPDNIERQKDARTSHATNMTLKPEAQAKLDYE